jgi:hypothetical protein
MEDPNNAVACRIWRTFREACTLIPGPKQCLRESACSEQMAVDLQRLNVMQSCIRPGEAVTWLSQGQNWHVTDLKREQSSMGKRLVPAGKAACCGRWAMAAWTQLNSIALSKAMCRPENRLGMLSRLDLDQSRYRGEPRHLEAPWMPSRPRRWPIMTANAHLRQLQPPARFLLVPCLLLVAVLSSNPSLLAHSLSLSLRIRAHHRPSFATPRLRNHSSILDTRYQ